MIKFTTVSKTITSKKGKPPKATNADTNKLELPYLTPEYLRGNNSAELAIADSSSVIVNDGDLILLWDGSNAGEFFRAKRGILSSTMVVLNHSENYIKDFLFYSLKSSEPFLKAQTSGSGIPHVDKEIFANLKIACYQDKEQTKIAAILSTIDRAIEQAEALIEKQQRIKTGLMQDLLTKGIDENGNIRSEETHEFKDSPLGRIPKEWDTVDLEKLYKTPIRDFGSFSSTKEITFLEEGIPFIKSEMIEVGRINWEGCSYISNEVHQKLNKSHVTKGLILFSKIGSALGKAVVYEGEHGICNSNAAVAKINIDEDKANSYFVTYVLNFETVQRQLKNMIISLLPRLNLGDINKIHIQRPSVEEQKLISEKLNSLDQRTNTALSALTKLHSLKSGLMQDLLTGNVPVNGLLLDDGLEIGAGL